METSKFELSFDSLFKLKDDLRIKTEECDVKEKEIECLKEKVAIRENDIIKIIKNKEYDCKVLIIETKPIFDVIEREKQYYNSEKQKIFDDIKRKVSESKTYNFIRLDDIYSYENEHIEFTKKNIEKIKESVIEKERAVDSELEWHKDTLNKNNELIKENKQLKEENKRLKDEYNWMKKLNENRRTMVWEK